MRLAGTTTLGSVVVRTTFGSVRGGTMLASDPASAASIGWTTSSRCTFVATVERQASITHCVVTYSATTYGREV